MNTGGQPVGLRQRSPVADFRRCERTFGTSQGSPYRRLEFALATRNPTIALSAAADLPRVRVQDALALTLLLRDVDPARCERAALRLEQLLVRELRLSLTEAQLALASLVALGGSDAAAGAGALLGLLEVRGERRPAEVLEAWRALASS